MALLELFDEYSQFDPGEKGFELLLDQRSEAWDNLVTVLANRLQR